MNRKLKRRLLSWLFKVKNYPASAFSVRKLDYPKKDLLILVDSYKEYEARLHSCRKEPETVDWIERFCSGESIFYDVGANVGAYSLVAAANGARVCAFEPSYANFCKLNKNVSVNNYDDRIDCFPVALAAGTGTWRFKYFDTIPGSSRGYFYRERRSHATEIAPETEKATLHYTMDDFVATFNLPHPTMLKVDVDGEEFGVIRGAGGILKSSALQTILIEIDDSLRESESLLEMLHQHGFKLESKHKRDGAIHNYILLRE